MNYCIFYVLVTENETTNNLGVKFSFNASITSAENSLEQKLVEWRETTKDTSIFLSTLHQI